MNFKVKYTPMLGLSYLTYYKLKKYKKNDYNDMSVNMFGEPTSFSSPFWFLHSLQEIFVDEVYNFNKSDKPLKIIDCGANIGLSCIYLKKLFPNANIFAIEPDLKVYKQLKSNLVSHGMSNIETINSAVWIHDNGLSFISEGSVGGKISINSATDVKVNSIRLKTLLLQDEIFFLKIDIEGAEYEVMKDCKDSLNNVQNLFIEFHTEKNKENNLDEILNWVRAAGFKYYIKEAWENMSHPFTRQYNDFFHMQLNIFCFRND